MKLVSFGNIKLDKSVMIFNMGPASYCPTDALGMCPLGHKHGDNSCYAYKAERLYKQVLPYRERQRAFWCRESAEEISARLLKWKRKSTKFFRFSEAGDFRTQQDVNKMTTVCNTLTREARLKCYGYTARHDLNMSLLAESCTLIMSGGHEIENCSTSIVIAKHDDVPEGFYVCPGSSCMSKCFACWKRSNKIAFRRH